MMNKVLVESTSHGKTSTLLGFFIILAILLQNAAAQYRCTNPNRNSGYCVSIYECPSLIDVVSRNQLTNSERQFLQNSQCQSGFGRPPFLCCTADMDYTQGVRTTTTVRSVTRPPTAPITSQQPAAPSNGMGNVLPQPPRCGQNSFGDKIYNGNDTTIDEYTWMVLLEYTEKSGRRTLNCGGSLINQRYVLTAAHCVVGAILQQIGKLATVRLGEYDINSEIDCIDNDCNKKVVELGYETVIPHPQFDPASENRHHDIALIRLNADVTYSDFINPVCLPLSTSGSEDISAGEQLIVAGWGRTLLARQSNVKKQLALPVNDHNACARKYSTRNVNLIESQLCAGGEFAKDSCDGDSGGPLMRQQGSQKRWYLEGIVSFGNRCGLEGWPGVYTRVADYIPWIQEQLKP